MYLLLYLQDLYSKSLVDTVKLTRPQIHKKVSSIELTF